MEITPITHINTNVQKLRFVSVELSPISIYNNIIILEKAILSFHTDRAATHTFLEYILIGVYMKTADKSISKLSFKDLQQVL